MSLIVRFILSIWVWANLFVATIGLSALTVVFSWFRASMKYFDWTNRTWARWMLAISGVKVRVEGAENAPAGEARIFVSNHRSWFDVFALSASLPGRCRFVAKKELARIPVFGRAWQVAGHICVDRGDRQSAVRSLEEAGNLMRANSSGVIIFAEGTRSRTDEMLPFKKGAFMLALHTSVDIVPIGVSGSAEVLGKGGFLVRPGTITIRIGPPIHTADYGFENRDRLMKRTRAEIERLSGRATEPSPAS
jgi:1-acyl-sn-glycerol-3-phosphate acyltransferase